MSMGNARPLPLWAFAHNMRSLESFAVSPHLRSTAMPITQLEVLSRRITVASFSKTRTGGIYHMSILVCDCAGTSEGRLCRQRAGLRALWRVVRGLAAFLNNLSVVS